MTNRPNDPWSGRPPGHVGHAHFWERPQSRRRFLQSAGAAGLALGSGLWWPERVLAGGKPSPPKPIPETTEVFPGIFIHAVPLGPVDQGHEPSLITDFNGMVGKCRVTGTGTGTGFAKPLLFQADMSFMKGVYVGEDGKHHHGTFGFIWLDLFDGPVGTNQKFDFNPHTTPNGVVWTARIAPDAVKVHLGDGTASMRLGNAKVFDDHNLKNSLSGPPYTLEPVPATVSFDVRWSGVTRRVKVRDQKNRYAGKFIENTATIEWSAKESGFAFTSDPAKTSKSVFAVIGHERNGVFFDKDDDDDDD